ncbi:unnamed protein product [Caenorhabditis angaria]|uniref:Uncharacterized protein n=1 Tax=Caenorhabditis angaria TaxID=860376 RepID=A0A9P1N0S5_9PELO|nr:unnamed protein product [Caenorhabditis angaria]
MIFQIFLLLLTILRFNESTVVSFENSLICGYYGRRWCVIGIFLEADENLMFRNFDEILFTRRYCSNGRIHFKTRPTGMDFDGPFQSSYEVVVGLRHNCTRNGDIFDARFDHDVAESDEPITIITLEDLTDVGERYVDDRVRAWKRTHFQNTVVEGRNLMDWEYDYGRFRWNFRT